MFCPICKAEYRRGFTICNDCGARLVRELPEHQPELPHKMIDLYSPNNEPELAMLKSILEAEGITYFVKNENFGSMEVGPQIALFNKRMIMCPDDQCERASELIRDYLGHTVRKEDKPGQGYSLFDKMRMAFEILLFGWIMPGKKNRRSGD